MINISENECDSVSNECYADVVATGISISERSESSKSLDEVILYNGERFRIRNVKGDGNCLFRCFALLLYNNESKYDEVRQEIVEFIVANWEQQKEIIQFSGNGFHYANAEHYRVVMGADKCFGTDHEVAVFVQLKKTAVNVFKYNKEGDLKRYPFNVGHEQKESLDHVSRA